RQVAERLKHTFMSALDREDIYGLVIALTGVERGLDRFATRFESYRPEHCSPEMIRTVDLIRQIIGELGRAIPAIDRRKQIKPRLEAIGRIQREGNDVCREAVGKLLRSHQRPTDLLMYKDLYEQLESIIERCAQVGSLVERISIKNA